MFQASIHEVNDEIFMRAGCCEDEDCPMVSTNVVLVNSVLKSMYSPWTICWCSWAGTGGKVEAANSCCGNTVEPASICCGGKVEAANCCGSKAAGASCCGGEVAADNSCCDSKVAAGNSCCSGKVEVGNICCSVEAAGDECAGGFAVATAGAGS